MDTLTESFEWAEGMDLDNLPKNRLLKAVVKSPSPEGTTFHPDDPEYPVRLFAEQEVMKAARSLIGKEVGLNHQKFPIYGAYCVDAEWNEEEKQAEAILFVPEVYAQKVENKEIGKVSIEYNWRKENRTDKGVEFEGLVLSRVDLLDGLNAGDKTTSVTLFESASQTGRVEGSITLKEGKTLGEPMGQFEDWDACIAWASEQPDIGDPEAYCGYIKSQTESGKSKEEIIESLKTMTFKKVESADSKPPEKKPEEIIAEKDKRIKDLEESVQIAITATADLKKNQDKTVEDAVKQTKLELAQKIEKAIPFEFVTQKAGMGIQHMVQELKKVVRETKKECE